MESFDDGVLEMMVGRYTTVEVEEVEGDCECVGLLKNARNATIVMAIDFIMCFRKQVRAHCHLLFCYNVWLWTTFITFREFLKKKNCAHSKNGRCLLLIECRPLVYESF